MRDLQKLPHFYFWQSLVWSKPSRVGNTVIGYVTCQHTDCLYVAFSVWVAIEQGTWLHHLVFTKDEQICCTFLWAECVQGAEPDKFVCSIWRPGSFWKKCVLVGTNVQESQTRLSGAECPWCPSTSTSSEKLQEDRTMILEDRRVTVAEVAQKLNICQE